MARVDFLNLTPINLRNKYMPVIKKFPMYGVDIIITINRRTWGWISLFRRREVNTIQPESFLVKTAAGTAQKHALIKER